MRHCFRAEYDGIELRPLEERDIEQLRIWRNDPENSRYIRKLPVLSPEDQVRWFESYLNDENDLTFAICKDGELLGSVSLYDPEGDKVEFGHLMVGVKGNGVGTRATHAALGLAFGELGYDKVVAEVSVDNTAALIIYVRTGFCVVGRRYSEKAQMDEFALVLDRCRYECLAKSIAPQQCADAN